MSLTPELRLYNTLTRKKLRFEPIHRENVRVYACGPKAHSSLSGLLPSGGEDVRGTEALERHDLR